MGTAALGIKRSRSLPHMRRQSSQILDPAVHTSLYAHRLLHLRPRLHVRVQQHVQPHRSTWIWRSANVDVALREPGSGAPRTWMWQSANLDLVRREPGRGDPRTRARRPSVCKVSGRIPLREPGRGAPRTRARRPAAAKFSGRIPCAALL